MGGDWWNYLFMMVRIRGHSLGGALTVVEPGYGFLNWIASEAGWGIWFPNLVCAAIFVWGLLAFSRRQPNCWLAVAVAIPYFVIVVAMGYTRQSAALGFVMLAIARSARGEMAKAAGFLGIAVLFHTSSIVMWPVLGLAAARRGPGTVLLIGILGGIVLYEVAGHLHELVGRYIGGGFVSSGAVPRLVMNVLPAIVFVTFRAQLVRNRMELRLWTTMSLLSLLSVALLLVFSASSAIADRLGLYLIPLQIVVWSRLPAIFGTRSRQSMAVLIGILVYSFLVEILWLNFGTWGHAWLPYRNYLWETATQKTPPRWFRQVE